MGHLLQVYIYMQKGVIVCVQLNCSVTCIHAALVSWKQFGKDYRIDLRTSTECLDQAILNANSLFFGFLYRIAGNFRGRKLTNFADLMPFVKVFSTRIGVAHFSLLNPRKFSPQNLIFQRFVKVISLLYDMLLVHCTYSG